MNIRSVTEILASEGLVEPKLTVLVPNADNYRVLLLQPHGDIEASASGVRNRDGTLAQRQFGAFLVSAQEANADLVITPEYSMPWDTLVGAIKAGTVPIEGKLWVLGCESIKYSELESLKEDLSESATVLYETLQADDGRFTDPLAYVFVARPADGKSPLRIVILVQFKTHPMADQDHFERNGLQTGSFIYQFGGTANSIRLASLICSDTFAFQDAHAQDLYDRALIIHIQLNPKPRQYQFRSYRDRLLELDGDATEIICLNWAKDVCVWNEDQEDPWRNISASAWYLKPDKFDCRDDTLCANHKRGLYYTWFDTLQTHALFFNFEPATYQLEATKVAHIGVHATVSRRRGPQLTHTCTWDDTHHAWVQQGQATDGFAGIVAQSGNAQAEIKRLADSNPLEAERVLALCAGKIEHAENWHDVRKLDSCTIDFSEVIYRITFCQDTDPGACDFRTARLRRCANIWNILTAGNHLPRALNDLSGGFRLEWHSTSPHQNAISEEGKRATLIYMGEECSLANVEATAMSAAEYLRRSYPNWEEALSARQRLAVWYTMGQEIKLFDEHPYVKIDKTGDKSEFDVGRGE